MLKNWDDLRFLVSISRAGNMAAAAMGMGTNAATVSRRMSRLAENLGFDPFIRTPDGWVLDYRLSELVALVEDFEGSVTALMNLMPQPSEAVRDLRIGTAPYIQYFALSRTLAEFTVECPNINLILRESILYQDHLGDCDLILTSRRPKQGRIVCKPVGSTRFDAFGYDQSETN